MTPDINYSFLPKHMQEGMKLYIEQGIPPGSFLEAIITNNFVGAFERADDINKFALEKYAQFLICEAPRGCWGSITVMNAWIQYKGFSELREKTSAER